MKLMLSDRPDAEILRREAVDGARLLFPFSDMGSLSVGAVELGY